MEFFVKKFLPSPKTQKLSPVFSLGLLYTVGVYFVCLFGWFFTFASLLTLSELIFQYNVKYGQGSYFCIECTVF